MTPVWLYDLALSLHLLGAFTLVSGTVVAIVGFEAARRRTSCSEIALVLGLARVGALLVVGGVFLAGAFGLWLVDLGHWGYGTPWVDAAIGLLGMVAVVGWAGGQRPKRARKLAGALATRGLPPSTELRALLGDRITLVLNYLAAGALLAIVVLMVAKPGSPHH